MIAFLGFVWLAAAIDPRSGLVAFVVFFVYKIAKPFVKGRKQGNVYVFTKDNYTDFMIFLNKIAIQKWLLDYDNVTSIMKKYTKTYTIVTLFILMVSVVVGIYVAPIEGILLGTIEIVVVDNYVTMLVAEEIADANNVIIEVHTPFMGMIVKVSPRCG